MHTVDAILMQLESGCDLNLVRSAIAELALHHLQRSKECNNINALVHFTNAIGSLTLNVNATRQPITAGLHTALMDLELAIAAIESNETRHDLRVKRAKQITHDMLIEAAQRIHGKASSAAATGERAA